MHIRAVTLEDSASLAEIYNWYIVNSHCTFETYSLSATQMRERIALADARSPWFVLENDGMLLGYAYASIWKARAAYNRCHESTVYLHRDAIAAGHGKRLYQHLIDELRNAPIHLLIAIIALPNESSIGLHESLGFEKAGQLREAGYKFNKYIDVGYWQLIL